MRSRPVASVALLLGLLAVGLSLLNLLQPAWKICEVVSQNGETLQDCRCFGIKREVDLKKISFMESSAYSRWTECRGIIFDVRKYE